MPKYRYIAKSKDKEISDVLQASSKRELAKILRKDDLFLIEAEELRKEDRFALPFLNKVTFADKIFLTRNLQMMLSGGISLSRTLNMLSMQTKNRKLRNALLNIREEIHKGKSFSEGLGEYPDIFSEMFRSIIQLSEETGKIEENLNILTRQMEKESELRSKVKGALIYPSIIVCTIFGVGAVMLIVVVPKLAETFDSMGVELPASTQLIINLGNFLANSWYLIPIILIGLFYFLKTAVKTRPGKRAVDGILLKIPVVSSLIKKTNSAYTARTLDSLLSSGVPIIRGLEILSSNISNSYFKNAISSSIDVIKKGDKLSKALRPHEDLFSPLMVQMIEVGEETGNTSVVLSKTADFMEEEVFNLTKNLTTIIEPVLMVLIGIVVGFFAFSMLMPMYSVLEAL